MPSGFVVSNGSKILIWKQITTQRNTESGQGCCFQWFKDTNLKANHNLKPLVKSSAARCFQWFKDTNLKANHNMPVRFLYFGLVVSNGSKILIWKQITTSNSSLTCVRSCFQWFKDTNLKANHNVMNIINISLSVVSNGSKILIWKQITTASVDWSRAAELFPMVQRY